MTREWNRPITLTVSDCVFRGNSAGVWDALGVPSSVSTTGFGGAVYIASGGEVVLEDCVFEDNSATSGGGGQFLVSHSIMPLVVHCTRGLFPLWNG